VPEIDFLGDMQARVAAIAVSPSALRNMVGAGGVKSAQKFLSNKQILESIGRSQNFGDELNAITANLAAALPKRKLGGGHAWGPARKILNIFLSEAASNIHLRKAYGLARIQNLLELPLDSYVAKGIAGDTRELSLPSRLDRWRGVVHVTPTQNSQYQRLARIIARRLGYRHPVHLDLRYWRK
jgi:hypothetical protein